MLTRSVCYPGVCADQECVLSRSVCYPGRCANQECVLTRSVCYPTKPSLTALGFKVCEEGDKEGFHGQRIKQE